MCLWHERGVGEVDDGSPPDRAREALDRPPGQQRLGRVAAEVRVVSSVRGEPLHKKPSSTDDTVEAFSTSNASDRVLMSSRLVTTVGGRM